MTDLLMMGIALTLLISGSAPLSFAYSEIALRDEINSLPGVDFHVPFRQFSGYITVRSPRETFNSLEERKIFYWFLESANDPTSDPVVFWTNGGPGCSGLLGFFTEMGPFRPGKEGKLGFNPYSWNEKANMIFFESPEGTGFSHNSNGVYYADDRSTAALNFNFIVEFFVKFPNFKANDMFLASESYGGHYLPTLGLELERDESINFKGIAVGNPFVTLDSGDTSFFNTAWGHQMIAEPTWKQYQKDCKNNKRPNMEHCASLEIEMHIQMGKLNPYALDYPDCVPNAAAQSDQLLKTLLLATKHSDDASATKTFHAASVNNKLEYEPCEDDYITKYLNRHDVQVAIHAIDDSAGAILPWKKCSSNLKYSHFDSKVSMVPIYKQLLLNDLQILIYSGDDDSICGTVGTQDWIWDLGLELSDEVWSAYIVESEHVGFYSKWKNVKLAFVTIRDAGHEVPRYQPEVAKDMWNKFLSGVWYA